MSPWLYLQKLQGEVYNVLYHRLWIHSRQNLSTNETEIVLLLIQSFDDDKLFAIDDQLEGRDLATIFCITGF